MRTRQGAVLEALRRAKDFLDANAELLATVNKSSARRNLEEIAAHLAAHGVAQDGSGRASRGETARQRVMRVGLRFNHMRPIAAVARRKLQGVPEFLALTMPKANLTVEPLVVAARGMAEASKRHVDVLIENGLQDDFIAQLMGAAMELEKSIDERNVLRSVKTGSTAGLAAEEGRARTILRVLDSAVRPKLGDNRILLAQWNGAKQVRAIRSVRATPTSPIPKPVTPPVPTPATPPVPTPVAPPAASIPAALAESSITSHPPEAPA